MRAPLAERGVRFSARSVFRAFDISSPCFVRSIFQTRARAARAHRLSDCILPSFLAWFVDLRRRRGGVPARCKRNLAPRRRVGPGLRRGISTPFRRTVQRSLVRGRSRAGARLWRKQFAGLLKRPSARRGPGIVSVDRNVRSKCRCSCVLQFTS